MTPDEIENFKAEQAQHQRNYDALAPGEFEALLADGVRAKQANESIPPHWSSPSAQTWMMGYGMKLLAAYGRRRLSVAYLLDWIGFVIDNPRRASPSG